MNAKTNSYTKTEDPFAGEEDFSSLDQGLSSMAEGLSGKAEAPGIRPRVIPNPENAVAEIDEGTKKKIMAGFVAALISGTVTLVFTLIATFGKDTTGFMNSYMFIDVVLIYALAVGIFFKSRIAATTMFVYFLASKIYIWTTTEKFSGVFLAVVFLIFFFQAMMGTFEYHRQKKAH